MATTINKQRLLNHLCDGNSPPEQAPMPVLQQFIFGLCREEATAELAERAYRNLCERFFDWNEVRVSSIRELEEAMEGLSNTESRAQRLLSFLQEVFETTFSFDLEGLHKKGVKQAAKQLTRYAAASEYVGAWVVQRTLGGHAIPIDAPTLRCARRLGFVETNLEDLEVARAALEHLVPKAKGPSFTDAISDLANSHCWAGEPDCPGCPLAEECPTAQESGVAALSGGRPARVKPR